MQKCAVVFSDEESDDESVCFDIGMNYGPVDRIRANGQVVDN